MKDNQITNKDESVNFYRLYRPGGWKRIPVYSELTHFPQYNHIIIDDLKWIDIKGINTPFYNLIEWGQL